MTNEMTPKKMDTFHAVFDALELLGTAAGVFIYITLVHWFMASLLSKETMAYAMGALAATVILAIEFGKSMDAKPLSPAKEKT